MSTIYKHSYTQPASTCFGYLQVVHNYKLLQQQFVYIVIHNWIDARFHYITEIGDNYPSYQKCYEVV